jgi:RNA polymerase sigma factor (sigma-70 family)
MNPSIPIPSHDEDGSEGESDFQDLPAELPEGLSALLGTSDTVLQDQAWSAFVNTYSRIILHTARSMGSDYDAAMDRYAHVLEQLRGDDFRRLRTYVADGRGKFSTWLTVVARRLCLDHQRERYGRVRQGGDHGHDSSERRAVRRRLADLISEELDPERIGGPPDATPEAEFRARQLADAVSSAVSGLSGRDRLLLALRFQDDLPARQIADLMDFPTPFHVYRRIKSVLAALRQALEQRGFDDPTP